MIRNRLQFFRKSELLEELKAVKMKLLPEVLAQDWNKIYKSL